MRKEKDYTLLAVIVCLFFGFVGSGGVSWSPGKCSKRTAQEYVIDLPEEISQSSGNDLEGRLSNDTVFIYFKH